MNKSVLKNDLLSPDQSLSLLESNEASADEVFSRLDVDACHYVPCVDGQSVAPLIVTGFDSFTAPSSGMLAYSPKTVEKQQKDGKKSILVVDFEMLVMNLNSKKHFLDQPDGLLVVCPQKNEIHRAFYDHFLVNASCYRSVLLDNPTDPKIIFSKKPNRMELVNGKVMQEGDEVTIDPMTGKLWQGKLDLLPAESSPLTLVKSLPDTNRSTNGVRIAFHAFQRFDFQAIFNLERRRSRTATVGLYRTDMDCYRLLSDQDETFFSDMMAGGVPFSLEYWDSYGFGAGLPTNYRLPDLHNMKDVLPLSLKNALNAGQDHQIGTKAFNFRRTLYWQQLTTAFRETGKKLTQSSLHIIIRPVAKVALNLC